MKKLVSLIAIISVMTLGMTVFAAAEDTNKSAAANKMFLVKGNVGWNLYPGLFGYLLYMQSYSEEAYDSLGMSSGLSLNLDVLFNVNSWLAVGLNAACLPIFQFRDVGGVSVNCELIPIVAQAQFFPAKFFHIDLGLGMGFVHGSGTSTSSGITFVDLIAGENTGQSFNVFRGPYFILNYGLGFQIDLTGQDNFGIDLFLKFYDIIGHPGIDSLASIAEKYAKVPGFLMMFTMNTGIGVYFRF